MKILLAVNAGSSSVKVSVYSLTESQPPQQLAETQITGLTAPPAQLSHSRSGHQVHKNKDVEVSSQDDAFKTILQVLTDDDGLKEISSKDDVAVVSHRIVHGGDYDEAKIITKDTYHHLEKLSDLAPLHNGPALTIVDSCIRQLPEAVNVACFDSQFHATIPPHIATYPINQDVAKNNHLRKFGFHGISYSFITRSVAEFLGKDAGEVNIIALHLGSGASACAVKGGKSWDTSMGLTPVAGLPGATRSGSVDPSLVFHYASDVGKLSPSSTAHLHISKAEEILNKSSGWKALTGTTDFSVIASSSDPSHKLAFDLFVDRICGFLGSYYLSLEGRVDALVFAGGIGEKSSELRRAVTRRAACLGFALDEERNEAAGDKEGVVVDVGAEEKEARSKDGHRVLVCRTDEQFEMARMCAEKRELWT